jgi:HK97 family phage major capsid protein
MAGKKTAAQKATEPDARSPFFMVGAITRSEAVERAVDDAGVETRAAKPETFEIAVSSEFPVRRFDWMLGRVVRQVLDHSKAAVDMSRFTSGDAPLLVNHNEDDQVGVIDRAWIGEDKVLRAEVRFSQSARGQEIRQDVIDGIRKTISVGVLPRKKVIVEQDAENGDLQRVTKWQPVEASLAPIPADPTVGVNRNHEGGEEPTEGDEEEGAMGKKKVIEGRAVIEVDESDPRAAATEAEIRSLIGTPRDRNAELAEIAKMCRTYKVDLEPEWISRDLNPDQVGREILAALATKGAAQPGSEAIAPLTKKEARSYLYVDAIRQALGVDKRGGIVDEVHKFIESQLPSDYTRRGLQGNSVFVPVRLRDGVEFEGRTMASNAAGAGQELVFDEPRDLIDFYRNVAMVAKLGATILTGLSGNLIFPVLTQSARAYWMGENPPSPVPGQDLGFGLASTSPRSLMAKSIFSRQLAAQSPSANVDIDRLVRKEIGTAHGLARDFAAIAGTGVAGMPKGLQYLDDVHEIDFNPSGFDPFVDAVTAIADANAPTDAIAFMTTPTHAGFLRKALAAASAGSDRVWTGKIGDGEVTGYRAVATNQVPKTLGAGSNEHGVYGGNWSELYLPSWGAFELVVDPFTLSDSALIRVTSFEMADVFVRHPEAFFRANPGPTSF